jgi:hypothetical protein
MKKLFLSLILLMGINSINANNFNFQDFLIQSGSKLNYEKLNEKDRQKFFEFWSKIEKICSDAKNSFEKLVRENHEDMKMLKEILNKDEITFGVSLEAKSKK